MEATLKATLKSRLHKAKKVALLAVGSELRGDDAAGILVGKHLSEAPQKNQQQRQFKVFFGDTAPENLTGEIKKFQPTHLIIVDAADSAAKPGKITLIEPEESGGVSFCTHKLPLKILVDYLSWSLACCQIIIIGIQPEKLDFGAPLSKKVQASAIQVAKMIKEIL